MSAMKYIGFLLALVFVLMHENNAENCTACWTTYNDTAKDCTAIKTYITCLYDASGCEKRQMMMENIDKKRKSLSSCDLTKTCECQVTFMKADVAADTKKCAARKAELGCLMMSMGVACDATKKHMDIVSASETAAKAVDKCALSDTCTCQVTRAKADMAKMCTALQTEISCVASKKNKGCGGHKGPDDIGDHARKQMDKLSSCTKTDTCKCEIVYSKADLGTKAKECTAAKAAKKCLEDLKTNSTAGCDGKTARANVIKIFAQPRINKYCVAGADSVSGLGFAVGLCVLLLQMVMWI
ncbi:uncharacterized protein LOC121381018 [Gigantopelta aegis]|uniref:uncharacterized protein LOC121381018 n=1 Tax=Gigantopelta aegis TaxID=1735272 RepID=UPI001B88DE4B|nr:uncharacterized protein LOC121381018 [Gigantopelta aegis]